MISTLQIKHICPIHDTPPSDINNKLMSYANCKPRPYLIETNHTHTSQLYATPSNTFISIVCMMIDIYNIYYL